MQFQTPTIIATIALLIVPFILLFEKIEATTWTERLAHPSFVTEPNRHTPLFPTAQYLPSRITNNTVIDSSQKVIAIAGTVIIPPNSNLTIPAGTTIAFHEHSKLVVEGTLVAIGTPTRRIRFVSNESHPDNQTWNGIEIASGGKATIEYTLLKHGDPAISCLSGSAAEVHDSIISNGNVGVYSQTTNCSISNTTIQGPLYGIVALGHEPLMSNLQIVARKLDILRL
ncbi:MAG: hypothetical protein WD200_01115 [Candidatus Andersenbacteria bacterium]